MPNLILAFDVTAGTLVAYNGSTTSLNKLRQVPYTARVYLLQKPANFVQGASAYETLEDADTFGLRLGIWSDTTGTLDDSDEFKLVFAGESDWAWNADEECFDGTFNCRTQEMADAIGADKSASFFFAASYSLNEEIQTFYDHVGGATNCTVQCTTDDGGNAPVSVINGAIMFNSPLLLKNTVSGVIVALTVAEDGTFSTPIVPQS